jgi:hypothetical protein
MSKNLFDARSDMKEAMGAAHREMKESLTGRKSSKKIELYEQMTPEMLDEVAKKYGPDATIDYVLAMEKEKMGHGDN